ncbi:MAG: histidine--tRNA ligase [Candidatus Woesearchaeota archaeon]
MKVQNLRGTRDFYPELMRELNKIFQIWKDVAVSFGYEEVDGPLLEPVELWTLKSGAEIPEQMYRFKDKGDREVAIRPELTPTLARMVAQKQKTLQKPIKWFSIPRCWRYEAPQSGRLREFFQLNIDCLGTESMMADAEVIATAVEIMKKLGCTDKDFYVRLNNRRLITALLEGCGIKEKMQDVCRIIDKREKLKAEDFELSLKDLGVEEAQIVEIKKVLEYKSIEDVNYGKLSDEGKSGYDELKELIQLLNYISNYIKIDFSIMRGFDYYTSTVFEIFDAKGEFRAIAGGGRYDDLVSDFGGEKCPGIGYGMGDVVLSLFLKKLGKGIETKRQIDYFIAAVNKDVMPKAMEIATSLRKKASVEIDIVGRSFRKQMEYANSIGASKVIIVGPKDLEEKKVTLKEMESGNEKKVKIGELLL